MIVSDACGYTTLLRDRREAGCEREARELHDSSRRYVSASTIGRIWISMIRDPAD